MTSTSGDETPPTPPSTTVPPDGEAVAAAAPAIRDQPTEPVSLEPPTQELPIEQPTQPVAPEPRTQQWSMPQPAQQPPPTAAPVTSSPWSAPDGPHGSTPSAAPQSAPSQAAPSQAAPATPAFPGAAAPRDPYAPQQQPYAGAPQPYAAPPQPVAPWPGQAQPASGATWPGAGEPAAYRPYGPFPAAPGTAASPGYGPSQGGAPPAGPSTVVGFPAGPAAPRPSRRFGWPLVLVAALIAAVVGAASALAVGGRAGASTARPASIASIGQSTTGSVPVQGSSTGSPAWEKVASAVKASVVAITVTTSSGEAEGSGVVLDTAGHVLTNNHVVDGAQGNTVQVTLSDGRIFDATIKGTDATTDLAVVTLKNPPSDLSPAALGDSSTVIVGQPVMAVGNPLGLQNTVTTGVVSAVNRPVATATSSSDNSSDPVVTNAIQVDAAINPGNSGGPLFDGQGKVIGITSSIASLSSSSTFGSSSESGSIGLGFAIPVDLVKNIASQLIANGSAQHAFLGVSLTDGTATADGVTRRGALVKSVTSGSPAAGAGIKVNDVIVAIGDDATPGSESLTAFVRAMSAGDSVRLTLVRGGKAVTVDATLAARTERATSLPQSTQGSGDSGPGGGNGPGSGSGQGGGNG